MSPEPIPAPVVNQGFEDPWAAWQARGAARDRATRRKLFIVATVLIFFLAILSALALLK
jgi:hypothetical protein